MVIVNNIYVSILWKVSQDFILKNEIISRKKKIEIIYKYYGFILSDLIKMSIIYIIFFCEANIIYNLCYIDILMTK